MKFKELAVAYINETVTNPDYHSKFLTPDGLIRLLVAREYVVDKSLEMFKKWVVSILHILTMCKNWRLDFKIDEIDVEKIRPLLLKQIVILHKYDKEDRYCLVIRTRFHKPAA